MTAIDHRQLQGQVAVVTGGTVGIGRAVCISLAREGAHVIAVGRNEVRLQETIAEMDRLGAGAEHRGLRLDVRNPSDMDSMADFAVEQFGSIDILISAAGILRPKGGNLRTLQQMTASEWDEVLDTNLKGVFLANRAVLPAMIKQRRGNIVNVSSTSGRKGLAYDSAYCASKFGVIGLTESLAEEMRQYNIRVQALLPGAISTGMWDQNGPLPKPGNIITPENVADLIIYLVTLPDDATLSTPIIEPLKTHVRPRWLNRPGQEGIRVTA